MASATLTAAEIAQLVGGTLTGDSSVVLRDVQKIEEAQKGDITFLSNPKYLRFAETTGASCILVPTDFSAPAAPGATLVAVHNPYEAFLRVLQFFHPAHAPAPGERHPSAIIDPTANIAATAHIAAGVVVGARCRIAEGAVLMPNVVLYDGVEIGESSVVHAGAICYDRTIIGKSCIIHAGAVLGADGFGFVEHADGSYEKIPQVGNVVLGDHVEIGANTCIDRATMGSTKVENGVKIDNMVHIAHNVVVGEHTAIAAQAGISGSAHIGKRNRIAGQVGMIGHITTADDVVVIAQSGISKSIAQKGRYFGSPAKEFRAALREEGALRQLPDLIGEFRELRRRVQELEQKKD